MTHALQAHRGEILHFVADPAADDRAVEHFPDGLLIVRDGRIAACGPHEQLHHHLDADTPVVDHDGALLLPGLIDTHVHYSQTDIIASPGAHLLEWLERYTYPAEEAFADPRHAAVVAEFFCDELLRNGTTTASCFATVHPGSVDALFTAAARRRMRLIAGKVLMDSNSPADLRDASAASGDRESRDLIARWHGHDRLHYAVTPRFAPASSAEQLHAAGALFHEIPGLYMQSHVAETKDEVRWATELFPQSRSYFDIYDRHQLLGTRAIYAHAIWLDDTDRARCAATDTSISFCPSSNLFLGSGLFDLAATREHGIRIGLGTDVGAGTSLSLLHTLADAYKVLALRGQHLSALEGFYLATLGGARSLHLEDTIGSFRPGCEADFIVIDSRATPLLARRTARAHTLEERLFAVMMLSDQRCIRRTYVLGEERGGDARAS